jgi:ubiquinone/menaquinone biosynthesis C-methylase UbiE
MFTVFLILIAVISFLVLVWLLSSLTGFIRTWTPYVATNKPDSEVIISLLKLRPGEKFVEPGSGNGRIVFLAQQKYPTSQCTGFERVWHLYWLCKIKAWFKKSPAKFSNQDFFEVSWQGVDAIYCYLLPRMMPEIERKFLSECNPGARAVVRDFPFPKLRPSQVLERPFNHVLYVYLK